MSISKQIRNRYYSLFGLPGLERAAIQLQGRLAAGDPAIELPIVSLTTVPKRIPHLKPTLVSLLRQALPPKEIHLNLGKDLFRGVEIPAFLKGLKTVKIQWIEQDIGPATKYIPTLERYEGSRQLIVIVDDDMYYAPQLMQDLVAAERQSGGRQIFCANGFKVPSNLLSASRPSDKALTQGIQRVAIVEGCGGYTLRPGFVKAEVLRDLRHAPGRALFDDDIWLSGHLSRAKIEKFQIATGKRKSLINTMESAISGDRAQLQTDVMRHFEADWSADEISAV